VIRLTSALALVLALSACTSSPPSTPSTSAPTSAPPGSAAAAAPSYRYQPGVNLCEKTDVGVVAPLNLTVKSKSGTPPQAGPGEACLIEATSPSGRPASLRVEAVVLPNADTAKQLYKTQHETTRMQPDGAISGLGDEAEGLTLQTDPGFKYAEYRVHLRRDNLVIEVWLAVGGDDFVPKATLQAMARTVAAATLSLADGAWHTN
jgi:hypothetical protein